MAPPVSQPGLNPNNAPLFQLLAGENQQTLRTLQEGVSEIRLFMENINSLLQAQVTENALKERRIALLETQITQLQETHRTELQARDAQIRALQDDLNEIYERIDTIIRDTALQQNHLEALQGHHNQLSHRFYGHNHSVLKAKMDYSTKFGETGTPHYPP